MQSKISVVINTYNEEKNIRSALESVKWADEIVVCDMHSTDNTVEIAKKYKAKVVYHKLTHFVEPARNFAIKQASNSWVLVLDADEVISDNLRNELVKIISKENSYSYFELPRKNIIFGKWMKASMWWPDYNIRFFKNGHVTWNEEIHSNPSTIGMGTKLEEEEKFAIVHNNYTSVTQFVDRLNRYSTIQAQELFNKKTKFSYSDLLTKPLEEFLSRYFSKRGFEDGLHGLGLSLLQSFSFVVVYLKLWELQGFKDIEVDIKEVEKISKKAGRDIKYWFNFSKLSKNPVKRILQKAKNKII